MSFDGETLQRYATIRSREAVVWEAIDCIDSSKDEHIQISFKGPKRLLLEAVTFGSFLWDVESHVDSRYHFVLNGIYKKVSSFMCSVNLSLDQSLYEKQFYSLCVRRSFGQGKRRVNKRTSLAQKEDVIKRTVYVSDIDQHVKKRGICWF
ncbi:hypothetical protein YC2023_073892 [Brassica napus]